MSQQKIPAWAQVVCLVLLTCLAGCGKGKYEKLMKQRIDQLNNPQKYGMLIWKEVDTDLNYKANLPKGEQTVSQTAESGITTEDREVVFGNKRYKLTYRSFGQNTNASTVAAQVEQQYRNSGYSDFVPEDGGPPAGGGGENSFDLVNEDGVRARIEVMQLGPSAVATMAVIAAPLEDPDGTKRPGLEPSDCDEFFDSVRLFRR